MADAITPPVHPLNRAPLGPMGLDLAAGLALRLVRPILMMLERQPQMASRVEQLGGGRLLRSIVQGANRQRQRALLLRRIHALRAQLSQ